MELFGLRRNSVYTSVQQQSERKPRALLHHVAKQAREAQSKWGPVQYLDASSAHTREYAQLQLARGEVAQVAEGWQHPRDDETLCKH
jgi:hypothetical protein